MLKTTLYRTLARRSGDVDPDASGRFVRHFISLTATKIADGLINPKLVLAWIMGAVGAPGYLIGALVPVREAGALLPQIALAREIQRQPVRKLFWSVGSFVQGLAAFGIAIAALTLQGAAAGWAIVLCLGILATARASCSASHKDVLARTVEKGARGTVSGAAGTVAAVSVFGFAVLLSIGVIPREPASIAVAIMVAGGLWIVGAIVFAGLDEPPDSRGNESFETIAEIIKPLRTDSAFRDYILVRGLLISTALAPPFLVMLGNSRETAQLGNLGLLLLASSTAAVSSSYIWGRLSDRSSRRTLIYAALIASLSLGGAAALGIATGGIGGSWLAALFVFGAQIAYEGVRAGRKTYLTDMDTHGGKAIYTALSNTMIGVLLLLGGGFGWLADVAGPAIVLAIFAALSALAAVAALGLSEVQDSSG